MLFMPDCITTLETQYTHFIEEISRGQQSTGRQGGCILQCLGIYDEGANVSIPPHPPPCPNPVPINSMQFIDVVCMYLAQIHFFISSFIATNLTSFFIRFLYFNDPLKS